MEWSKTLPKLTKAITLKEQRMKTNNKSVVRCALQLSVMDQVINALPSNWVFFWTYLIMVSLPGAAAIYGITLGEYRQGLLILGCILTGFFLPGLMIWNLVVQFPVQEKQWWKNTNQKVRAYKILLPYAQMCPVWGDTGSFASYMNNVLKAIAVSAKGYDRDRHDKQGFAFEMEFRRIHQVMKLGGLLYSDDWGYYRK